MDKKKILLILRTPPPYGGGELQHEALRDYFACKKDYIILESHSDRRDKTNQGAFALWKINEFVIIWFRIVCALLIMRPRLLFMALGKDFPTFVRDSLLVWIAYLFCVPVVIELPGSYFYFLEKGGFYEWYGKLVLSRIMCIRVLGESISKRLSQYGVNNTVVFDNGVSTGDSIHEHITTSESDLNILFVGTLSPQKGFDVLVDAITVLCKRIEHFRVHCLGQWISDDYMKTMHVRLLESDLCDHFIFHGLKFGKDKWNVYSQCHVLALPSFNEGQPLVILEALSFGLIVVATSVGAIPDTIENEKNGFLIPRGDSKTLADVLTSLSRNQGIRKQMKAENMNLFLRRFTMNAFLKKYESFLNACADKTLVPKGQIYRLSE